jgi:xanthine dehydrogenase iron-sulfur cluster and FAD-binding subunit A
MTNSHILVQEFDYLRPTSVKEATAMLAEHGDGARVLAGGTDLLVQMKMERFAPQQLVHIQDIAALKGITTSAGTVRIGAGTTIWSLRNDPRIRAHYPALAEACASFSTTQVQWMGTLGGNLCNASPASDSAPPLLAFAAQAVIEGPDGERRLALEEFFLGPGKTALQRGELLVGVVIPRPPPGTGSAFLKMSRVSADIAKANASAVLMREGERIVRCRLAFGSVAPTPMRAPRAEALLAGRAFQSNLIAEAASIASEEVVPIDDVRSTAWYRRQVVKAMTHDALQAAWDRATQEAPAAFAEDAARLEERATAPTGKPLPGLRSLAAEPTPVQLLVNGVKHSLLVRPNELLLNVLREKLELTGSKYGCGIGECSACTVQMDGVPVLSCLVLAIAAQGKDIVTVEGLRRPDGTLDPLQEAFIEHAGFQCGYCTPGMLMTAKALLAENQSPTEEQVRDYLKGNICRCTGYASIVRSVMGAAVTSGGARG